jgi:hypothetical protein
MQSTAAPAASGSTVTPQQQNLMARQMVIRQAVDMWLPIFTRTYSASNNQGPGTIDNVPLRNVGLIKRLLIKVTAGVSHTGAMQLSANGLSNFFSNITFTDLSNQTRINTTGWHLSAISSAKRRRPYGAAAQLDNPSPYWSSVDPNFDAGGVSFNPMGFGNNNDAIFAPYKLTAAELPNFPLVMYFEVPFSYTDHDLRGAIYANVTNATMNLQFTVNPQMFNASGGAQSHQGIYITPAGTAILEGFTVQVYQNFLDQLPIAQQGGPILPLLDLSTAYLLNNTAVSGIVVNQDNPIPFANFRDFMSILMIYNDPAEYTTTECIDYLALQSANYTNILRLDASTNYFLSRLILGDDFPLANFYFDFRHKPVSTIQYGNMEMIVNPNTVSSPATSILVGFESLALINMITQAGSLYGS